MDAVQAANSGHPGMPMGMADVATVLFGKFLKFDPSDPAWPDRDRFVLSAGHGSMLLYSPAVPHRLRGHDDRAAAELPPARLADRGPPRVRPCGRNRDHHGPARPGARQRGRHGARRAAAARPLRRRPGRPPHLRHRLRRRPDGGHQSRGQLACRAPAPQPADRPLRRQPHQHRRLDLARLLGRHGRALCRLWLEQRRGRRPRSRAGRARAA